MIEKEKFERHLRGTNLSENTISSYMFAIKQYGEQYDDVTQKKLREYKVYDDEDIFGDGKPPVRRGLPAGVTPKQLSGKLPVSDDVNNRVIGDPWFKHFDKKWIEAYAAAMKKVIDNHAQLLEKDGIYAASYKA